MKLVIVQPGNVLPCTLFSCSLRWWTLVKAASSPTGQSNRPTPGHLFSIAMILVIGISSLFWLPMNKSLLRLRCFHLAITPKIPSLFDAVLISLISISGVYSFKLLFGSGLFGLFGSGLLVIVGLVAFTIVFVLFGSGLLLFVSLCVWVILELVRAWLLLFEDSKFVWMKVFFFFFFPLFLLLFILTLITIFCGLSLYASVFESIGLCKGILISCVSNSYFGIGIFTVCMTGSVWIVGIGISKDCSTVLISNFGTLIDLSV